MDLDAGIEGLQFPLVDCEMLVAVITQVNGLGAIVGELMCAGTADSEGRIGSWGVFLSVPGVCVTGGEEYAATLHL